MIEADIVRCEEILQNACKMYCSWYTTGYPQMTPSNMAYELVTYIREALYELNKEE